ncbi:MAG: phosphoribosylanthranilate isomerase [Gemmatimonadaceae bacterium]
MAEVKFCGLVRTTDANRAASLGASYLGVIFAGGPRLRTALEARALFDGAANAGAFRRVGVFGAQSAAAIASTAAEAALDVVQLHGESSQALVEALRPAFGGKIWRVLRVRGAVDAVALREAAAGVDALVVDAHVEGQLGGTGVTLDWAALASALDATGRPARLILAGGLTPANVGEAVRLVGPDVVDVSSGVESAPGIKDHERMRAFFSAAQGRAG